MDRIDRMVIKFREALETTERFEAPELAGYQHHLLSSLIMHAFNNVPYYSNILVAVCNGTDVDLRYWQDIPIMTRTQAQSNVDKLKTRSIPSHAGRISDDETSGSTGRPLRFQVNELVNVAALGMTDRLYRWWGFDGSKTMFNFVSPRSEIAGNGQMMIMGWRPGWNRGRHFLQQSTDNMDAHIKRLSEVRPDYMIIPSGLLDPLCNAAGSDPSGLRMDAVITRGGTVADDLRSRCQTVFHSPLIDQYGANEIGLMACQCPWCGEYHICSEAVLLEVLDEYDEPASPGAVGRIVVTSLYNYAMPFIRYEIGDYAEVGTRTPDCRIKLPTLKRIIGRYRNSFILKDGRILFPHPLMSGFRRFFAHVQLQVVQTDLDHLEVRYVPSDEPQQPDEAGLESWLRDELGHDFKVKLKQVSALARSPDGKFEDFVSEVSGDSRPAGR